MMFNRVIGIFRFDLKLYGEIEHSENATAQALLIVAAVSVIAALGNALGAQIAHHPFFPRFITSLIWGLVGWILYTAISFFVGTVLFKGHGIPAGVLRILGFSYVPQVLAIIPFMGALAGWLWSMAAGFLAIYTCMKLGSLKTLATIFIGFGLYLTGHIILGVTLGGFF